jgi:hypothetical protein
MHFERHLDFAEKAAKWMDAEFGWGPWKFGLDPILGLVPFVGDIIPIALTLYILWIGHQMDIPDDLRRKIIFNAMGDAVLGMIPVVGDVTDFFWHANTKNISLLRQYLTSRPIDGRVIADHSSLVAGA